RQQQPPIGAVRAARPDLLAVDDELVALQHGTGAQAGEVRARVWLGEELAPDLVGSQDVPQEALLLRLGTVVDERRADDGDAERVEGRRRVDPRHLLANDRLLHRPGSAPAILD